MLVDVAIYFCILLVYLPGLVIFTNRERSLQFPLTTFTFLGMFVFNACGSVLVIRPELVGRNHHFSFEYFLMLVIQVLLFYIIAIPYVSLSRKVMPPITSDDRVDGAFLKVLIGIIAAILGIYVMQVGIPPLLAIVNRNLTLNQMIDVRTRSLYGHPHFSYYNLGYTVLPILTAVYVLSRYAVCSSRKAKSLWIIPVCIGVSTLTGGKGSILEFGVALLVAYYLLSGWVTSKNAAQSMIGSGDSLDSGKFQFSYKRSVFYLLLATIPVLVMYRVYYGATLSFGETLVQLVNRIVGVYSECMAAVVSFVEQRGYLDGVTFPTVRGFFSHERYPVENAMHSFMFGGAGTVPLPAPAEGYVNFGWPGFIVLAIGTYFSVILVEQFLLRMPRNLMTISLLIFYSVLATKTAQMSLFATFVSLTYVVAFGILLLTRSMIGIRFGSGRLVQEVQ